MASGQFTKYLAAADKAGLTTTLKGPRPLTLFVPTDAALGTAWDALSPTDLQPILLYHLYGNKITPDLVLEQIKLKAAVLSFKGQRFSMNF